MSQLSFSSRLKQTGLAIFLSKLTSLIISKFAPNWTYSKVEDSFLTPKSKVINTSTIPHGIKLVNIDTKEGFIQGYQLGRGPTVVLVHSWSGGAYQFFPLMRGLSQCGFKALSFDHFGHGHSDGQHSSLLRFNAAVNSVLQYAHKHSTDGIEGIVGHSMGCISIANTQVNLIQGIPLLLISPVFNFKKYFSKQVKLQGLHPELSRKYLAKFERSYLRELDTMELTLKLGEYSANTVIVHDKEDKVNAILDSIKFCKANPLTKLVVTKGFGHNRVINSETVWQQLKSHLNYEDITANRFN